MCTALNYITDCHYFGRNLDWTHSYGEKVISTAKGSRIEFRNHAPQISRYAMMGMGIVSDNYPLYFDCVNEMGLCMAGLNFPDNAVYNEPVSGMDNIAQFELMLWVVCQCKNTDEAKVLLENANITNVSFSADLPATPMHWVVSDRSKSIVIEPVGDGLMVYDNPTGVLANNPPFPEQLENLNRDIPYSTASPSRFCRGVKLVNTAREFVGERETVDGFLCMLSHVGMIKTSENSQHTIYSSCINATKGIYYYKLYGDETVYETTFHNSRQMGDGNVL